MLKLEVVRAWWPILAFVLNGSFFLIIFALVKTFAKKEAIEELRIEHENLKQKVNDLPSHDDITDLKISIEQMRGDVREMRSTLKGLSRILSLLLENKLKKEEKQ